MSFLLTSLSEQIDVPWLHCFCGDYLVVHVFAAAVLEGDQFCASLGLFFLIICHIFFNKTGQGAILLCPFCERKFRDFSLC